METLENPSTDSVRCVCGNTAGSSGFFAYAMGREVVPDDTWDGVSMFCAGCARVFDQRTGVVVYHPAVITTMDGVHIKQQR